MGICSPDITAWLAVFRAPRKREVGVQLIFEKRPILVDKVDGTTMLEGKRYSRSLNKNSKSFRSWTSRILQDCQCEFKLSE